MDAGGVGEAPGGESEKTGGGSAGVGEGALSWRPVVARRSSRHKSTIWSRWREEQLQQIAVSSPSLRPKQ